MCIQKTGVVCVLEESEIFMSKVYVVMFMLHAPPAVRCYTSVNDPTAGLGSVSCDPLLSYVIYYYINSSVLQFIV